MSDKFILLVLDATLPGAADIVLNKIMESAGLSLAYPGADYVVMWSDRGRNIEMAPDDLLECLRSRRQISFQMWWGEARDVFCTFRANEEFLSFNLALDGVDQADRASLIGSLTRFVASKRHASAFRLLIVDLAGATADIDWEDRLSTGLRPDDPFPDLIIISSKCDIINKIDARYFRTSMKYNNYILVERIT